MYNCLVGGTQDATNFGIAFVATCAYENIRKVIAFVFCGKDRGRTYITLGAALDTVAGEG